MCTLYFHPYIPITNSMYLWNVISHFTLYSFVFWLCWKFCAHVSIFSFQGQYLFCHIALQDYLASFDIYSNFTWYMDKSRIQVMFVAIGWPFVDRRFSWEILYFVRLLRGLYDFRFMILVFYFTRGVLDSMIKFASKYQRDHYTENAFLLRL